MKKWSKFVALLAATAVGFAVVLYLCAAMLRPRLSTAAAVYPAEKVRAVP
jgi:hypothetical protein